MGTKALLITCLTTALGFQACAQTNTYQKGAAYDCTGVEVEHVDPKRLTKAEQIALLENSLLNSVDRYSKCIAKVQSQMAASGGGGGGSGTESEGGESGEGAQGAEPGEQEGLGSQEGATEGMEGQTTTSQTNSASGTVPNPTQSGGGGKRNQVIPPKDNDNIICALLWDEITNSTDEAEKQGLIKEYEDLKCSE